MVTAMIAGKFKLGKQIGKGSFGTIYAGMLITTGLRVAIKMEPVTCWVN
jgi:hypothetical protein